MNDRDLEADSQARRDAEDAALQRLAVIASRRSTADMEAHIPRMVRMLDDVGVAVIVLKGPVTRQRLYTDTEARPTGDIDLLVDPRRFRRATAAFAGQGYRRVGRRGHSDTLRGPQGAPTIDLHLTLPYVTAPPDRAFRIFHDHTATIRIDGHDIPALDEPTHVVHLAIHAMVDHYDPTSRSHDEWRRGHDSLSADQLAAAATIAASLGVSRVWNLALGTLDGSVTLESLDDLLPLWEVEPRMAALRAARRSGIPARVRWRDIERMITLQLGDGSLIKWRNDQGLGPLPQGRAAHMAANVHRLAWVTAAGLRRIVTREAPPT